MLRAHLLQELVLTLTYHCDRHIMHQSVDSTIQDCHLLTNWHRRILGLDKNLIVLSASVDGHGGHRIHIAGELGECLQLAILCHIYLQSTSHLLHTLNLSRATHTRDGNTDIDSRTEALVKQICLKIYLSVGNRDYIRRNIGRNVASLCLDNRQGCQ